MLRRCLQCIFLCPPTPAFGWWTGKGAGVRGGRERGEEGRRGGRNEPAYTRHVAECLADAAGEPLERLAARTTENALRLFGLSGV